VPDSSSDNDRPLRLPLASVIVPAYNEERGIARLLAALLADAAPGALDVVVVANGCTDRTAEVARGFGPDVRVIEEPVPGKANALNLGDGAARTFPRFYVDADIEIGYQAVRDTAERMAAAGVPVGAPRLSLRLAGRSAGVRAYYAVWRRLPYARDGLVGVGVYALSEAGRARFDRFPSLTADDLFIRNLFRPEERLSVGSATFLAHPPRDLRSLVAVQTRAQLGKRELHRARGAAAPLPGADRSRRAWAVQRIGALAGHPRVWPALPLYLAVHVVARVQARRRLFRGDTGWLRDESSRAADPLSAPTAP